MKTHSIRLALIATLCALLSACSQSAQTMPTSTTLPSATFTLTQAITATVTEISTLAATETPTPMSTPEGPIGELKFAMSVALYYERATWMTNEFGGITHRTFNGCTVTPKGGGEMPGQLPQVNLGGFIWEFSGTGLYVLTKSGADLYSQGRYVGSIFVNYGSNPTECQTVAEDLLKTVHSYSEYAQKGECTLSPAKRLAVGVKAKLLIDTNLRSEPRWGDTLILHLVGPADGEVDVVGGPVCGFTPYGEFTYWQIKLANGESGWVAEGDASQYFIEPVN